MLPGLARANRKVQVVPDAGEGSWFKCMLIIIGRGYTILEKKEELTS
jgi:hypothetical protein